MGIFMVRTILHTGDNLPANFVQNQFAINVSGITELDADEVTVAVKTFYDAVRGYLSSRVAATGHEVKFYALPGLKPNYPVTETTFNLAAQPAGTPAPSEVAIVTSLVGVREAGQAMARRRGRMFIGPLNQSTWGDDRPAAGMLTVISDATKDLAVDINAIENHRLGIWSTVNQSWAVCAGGFVDNAWDTQRRRGIQPTARTNWTLSV